MTLRGGKIIDGTACYDSIAFNERTMTIRARLAVAAVLTALRRAWPLNDDDAVCPVCGSPAATQENGTLLPHQLPVGGGYVTCPGSHAPAPGSSQAAP
jgi:hypothetical protein